MAVMAPEHFPRWSSCVLVALALAGCSGASRERAGEADAEGEEPDAAESARDAPGAPNDARPEPADAASPDGPPAGSDDSGAPLADARPADAGDMPAGMVLFENPGTKAGWSDCGTQQMGTVEDVTMPAFEGATALRMRQIFIGNNGTRYHAECIKRGLPAGADYYFGQAIWIPPDWQWTTQDVVFQQWAPESPASPWIGMMIGGSGGHHINYQVVRGPKSNTPTDVADIAELRGTWIRAVVRIHMATAGHFEVWVNGQKTYSTTGDFSTGVARGSGIRWSTGLYAGHWHNDKPAGGNDISIWHDHARIARTYEAAEPASWHE